MEIEMELKPELQPQDDDPLQKVIAMSGLPELVISAYHRQSYTFVIVVIVTIILFIGAIYGKLYSENDRKTRARELTVRIKDIGMPNFPIQQDIPIFYNGVASVTGSAIDPLFEIITMDQPLMKRVVKVLCWKEYAKDCYIQNGEMVGASKTYSYKKEWVLMTPRDFADSSKFHDQSYRDLNQPAPKDIDCRTFTASKVLVGPFQVSLIDLESAFGWKKFTDLFKYEDPVARVDPDGIWSYDEDSCSLIRQKVPGKDTIGDIIVSYKVLNADFDSKREVQMSACGIGKQEKLVRFSEMRTTLCEHFTGKKEFIKMHAN